MHRIVLNILLQKIGEAHETLQEFPDQTEVEQAKKSCVDTLNAIQDLAEQLCK